MLDLYGILYAIALKSNFNLIIAPIIVASKHNVHKELLLQVHQFNTMVKINFGLVVIVLLLIGILVLLV